MKIIKQIFVILLIITIPNISHSSWYQANILWEEVQASLNSVWGYLIPNNASKSIETFDNINLNKLKNWTTSVSIKMKHSSWDYFIFISTWTKITNRNWEIFDWTIKSPSRVSSNTLPEIPWNKKTLKTLKIWALNWASLEISKTAMLQFSTKGISDSIDRSLLEIYSFDEISKKYKLENINKKFDKSNETISVLVDHMGIFIITIQWEINYEDINDHWAKSYIENLYKKWALSNKDKYYPNNTLKRSELIKIALETFWHWKSDKIGNVDYIDVNKNEWFVPYLARAIEIWIIDWANENNNFRFRPWDNVTRAESLKIMIKASWLSHWSAPKLKFSDVKGWEWFSSYLNIATSNNIISWFDDWTFKFWNHVTRWSIAKIAIKTLEALE